MCRRPHRDREPRPAFSRHRGSRQPARHDPLSRGNPAHCEGVRRSRARRGAWRGPIRRMFEEMRLAGLGGPDVPGRPPLVSGSHSPGNRSAESLDSRLPEQTRLVVAALREANRLSTGDLALVMGLSRPSAIAS
jgi:hypothetical protein